MSNLLAFYITNRAGSLIYHIELSNKGPQLSGNDYIRAASTFHTLFSISKQVAPVSSGGIVSLEADSFRLRCFQTLTGFKFILLAEPNAMGSDMDDMLMSFYRLFSDYVQKNPFYKEGMLIKCHLFEERVRSLSEK